MTAIPDDALRLTWDEVYEQSVRLAEQIEQYCRETGGQFDAMLILPRGGYYPGNIVSRELGFESVDILHASIGSYQDAQTKQEDFRYGQMPPRELVAGKDILVIDEVCDTGKTLECLGRYLMENGAKSVKTGVMHYKPSMSQTSFVPDWFVEQTDKWIVYPWELHEPNGLKSSARRKASARL